MGDLEGDAGFLALSFVFGGIAGWLGMLRDYVHADMAWTCGAAFAVLWIITLVWPREGDEHGA